MLMLACKQESGFQGQQEVSDLFVLMGVSIKPLRLRRELSPDISFSKQVMYSASYSTIEGAHSFHCHLKERKMCCFLREQLQIKIPPCSSFFTCSHLPLNTQQKYLSLYLCLLEGHWRQPDSLAQRLEMISVSWRCRSSMTVKEVQALQLEG